MRIQNLKSWIMGVVLVSLMVYVPYLYYRYVLEHSKRLRPVVDGRIYRSGLLSADGFRAAHAQIGFKTVITFFDEHPDPTIYDHRFSFNKISEKDLCKELGVNYHFIFVQLANDAEANPGKAIGEFLKIMDDENNYPVLFHCKAGLHRTGVMAAVYRMEYEGWTVAQAMRELKAHGFGDFTANRANPYIRQYVLPYQPRWRQAPEREVKAIAVGNRKK